MRQQFVVDEVREGLEIAHVDFQDIVGISRHGKGGAYLRMLLHEAGKGVFLLLSVIAHGDAGNGPQAEAQLSGVQAGPVALDQAGGFQRGAPPGALRGREVHGLGQRRACHRAVTLQGAQDRKIETVYAHHWPNTSHWCVFRRIIRRQVALIAQSLQHACGIMTKSRGRRDAMGPFPHDAPRATISSGNPAGTDGFEFVEFAHPEPEKLDQLFRQMGFAPVARHKTRDITLYRQGDINFLLHAEPGPHAAVFVKEPGPSSPAMAWRVVDARHALQRALDAGAREYQGDGKSLEVPAVIGIGGSLLYFVETYTKKGSCYDADFDWLGESDARPEGLGFYYLDHLTHNVRRGRMDNWYGLYGKAFGFREIRFFDI